MKKLLHRVLMIGALAGLAASPLAAADPSPPAAPSPSAPQEKLVNINTASKVDLEKLPGVGEVLAERIIAGRPYKTVDDLKKVEGLGEKTFNRIKPLVTVE